MDLDLKVTCLQCEQPFHSEYLTSIAGFCGHSICKECAVATPFCPYPDCNAYQAFSEQNKNFLANDLFKLIDKEQEDIIATKKGLHGQLNKLSTAQPQPKARTSRAAAVVPISQPPPIPPRKISAVPKSPAFPPLNLAFQDLAAPNRRQYGVLVSNLPPITEEMLKGRFSIAGNVLDCVVCLNIKQEPSGYAYVWFDSKKSTDQAMSENNKSITGFNKQAKKMKVQLLSS